MTWRPKFSGGVGVEWRMPLESLSPTKIMGLFLLRRMELLVVMVVWNVEYPSSVAGFMLHALELLEAFQGP